MGDEFLLLFQQLNGVLGDHVELYREIVNSHGTVEAIVSDKVGAPEYFHDFVFYCITKTCRSLCAIELLFDNDLPEDSLIILRTLYENYLSIAYLMNNLDELDSFVSFKVGASAGRFQHPIRRGKELTNKIIDPKTEEEVFINKGMSWMANGTSFESDSLVHHSFYSYLCEHVHTHMIGSGNYREPNNRYYVYESSYVEVQVPYLTVYVSSLILQHIIMLKEINVSLESEINIVLSKTLKILFEVTDHLDFAQLDKSLKVNILNRLKDVKSDLKP